MTSVLPRLSCYESKDDISCCLDPGSPKICSHSFPAVLVDKRNSLTLTKFKWPCSKHTQT